MTSSSARGGRWRPIAAADDGWKLRNGDGDAAEAVEALERPATGLGAALSGQEAPIAAD